MKTVVIILSSLAIAAGVVVGWHEHEGSRAAARAEASAAGSSSASPSPGFLAPPAPPPPVERKKKRWKPRESAVVDVVRTDEPLGGVSGSSVEARSLPSPSAAPPAPGASPRLDAVAASIRKRDFAGAEKAAAALLDADAGLSAGEKESAERLLAKARALAKLALPSPEGGKSATLQEVLLANGLRLEAASIEETAERSEITLPSGIRFSAPREDILQVKPLETKVVVPSAADGSVWRELEPKLARLEHPIDIYVQGVQRLFRMGLEKEAFDLLDRLLARDDSEVIALLFTSDGGEQSLRDWRRAAGREPGGDRAPDASTAERDTAPAPAADAGVLDGLRDLVDEARTLYKGAAGKEGRAEDLSAAREKLDRALDLLAPLPSSDQAVRLLRSEVAQLISDVSRQLPF